MNKMFQTIGKTKLGGVIDGLIFSYHCPVSVSKLPRYAVRKTTKKDKIKIFQFILFFI